MLDAALFLAAPLASCLLLVGILGYLGLHVLERQVIFVDLALAQIAALGVVIGFTLGHDPGSAQSFLWSLSATTLGAGIFSLTRVRRESVPHEAIIGITYVVAYATTLVVADRAPEGAEHLKELMSGAVIWVTWRSVAVDAALVALVGLTHYLLRGPFILISTDPERAFREGRAVPWWDFVFYLTFGLAITVAVDTAGVLMVFAYLVAPAIIAIAACRGWRSRLLVAWSVGTAGSVVGLAASYRWDLPAGPAIVCALGLILVVFGLVRRLRRPGVAVASRRNDARAGR